MFEHQPPHRLLTAKLNELDHKSDDADHDGRDWTVDTQILAQMDGLWSQEVDPVTLALVDGADGTVTAREQLAVLASAFDTPEALLAAMAVPVVTQLVERGFLLPTGAPV